MSELTDEQRAMEGVKMALAERKKMWVEISPGMTAQELDDFLAHENERQAQVPPIGAEAPDFELDILDRERKRTGERVRLSSLRGKPVGLIFGSYT